MQALAGVVVCGAVVHVQQVGASGAQALGCTLCVCVCVDVYVRAAVLRIPGQGGHQSMKVQDAGAPGG